MIRFTNYFALFLLALAQTILAQIPKVSAGKIQRYEAFPSKHVDPRTVDVWLPEGYSPKKKYAVLYMHDGQMLFDSTTTWNKQEWGVDETLSRLVRMGKVQEVIVVGIWNNGNKRHSEYFPQKPFETLPEAARAEILQAKRSESQPFFTGTVQSDAYLRFLVTELKPFIDKTFATRKDRKHTFVAGSSMGGLISMYAISEYPHIFGGAACISTHWPGIFKTEGNPIPDAFFAYMRQNLPNPKTHKLYFDFGTATLDALYPPFQAKADLVLQEKGFTAKTWITRKFEGEDHSERAWRKRFEIPMQFLLGR